MQGGTVHAHACLHGPLRPSTTSSAECATACVTQQPTSPQLTPNAAPPCPRRAWVALVGVEEAQKKASVCIGSTSAKVCAKLGLTRVTYPDAPGIDTWVGCVLDVIKQADLVASA